MARENAGGGSVDCGKVLDKRRLPNAGLTADKNDAALAGPHCHESCRKRRQIALAFEQFHAKKTAQGSRTKVV